MIEISDKGNSLCEGRYETKGLFKEWSVHMEFRISSFELTEDKTENKLGSLRNLYFNL